MAISVLSGRKPKHPAEGREEGRKEASLSLRRVNEEKATATKMGGRASEGCTYIMDEDEGDSSLQSARSPKDGL